MVHLPKVKMCSLEQIAWSLLIMGRIGEEINEDQSEDGVRLRVWLCVHLCEHDSDCL